MANHKSAEKRNRQGESRRVHNKYYARSTRNAVKKLIKNSNKESANEELPKVMAKLDKLAKKKIIHKNKASNLKSKLSIHINSIS